MQPTNERTNVNIPSLIYKKKSHTECLVQSIWERRFCIVTIYAHVFPCANIYLCIYFTYMYTYACVCISLMRLAFFVRSLIIQKSCIVAADAGEDVDAAISCSRDGGRSLVTIMRHHKQMSLKRRRDERKNHKGRCVSMCFCETKLVHLKRDTHAIVIRWEQIRRCIGVVVLVIHTARTDQMGLHRTNAMTAHKYLIRTTKEHLLNL